MVQNMIYEKLQKKTYLTLFAVVILISFGVTNQAFSQTLVPEWIKNTAKWYSQDLISELEYLNSIKYLLENNIIKLEHEEQSTSKVSKDNSAIQEELEVSTKIVTKPRLRNCITLYDSYINLGEKKFLWYNDHINYINDCVRLYKDPIWNYQGPNRLDKLSETFTELRAASAASKKANPLNDPTIKVNSIISAGEQKFLVKFNICAGNISIDKAKMLIKSEIEVVQVGSNKDIPENSCRSYETLIHAKQKGNIQISIIEQVLKS